MDALMTSAISRKRAAYVLFMLLVVHVISHVDRSVLGILLEPIRKDQGYSDTQLGFLSGFAFAIFYATLGVPAAWLADRGNRRNFVAIACALWSVMTCACGLTKSFTQLALARIGVAVGEAGAGPASVSILSSLYPHEKRARALAIYSLAASIGILVGHPIAGPVADAYGWRWAFVAVGAPGVIIALIVRFTIAEPARTAAEREAAATQSMSSTLRYIWRSTACRYLIFGCALSAFLSYGLSSWIPAFLIRSHGMTATQVGLSISPITGLSGMLGGLLGGYLADRLGARDARWAVRMITIAKLFALPLLLTLFFAEDLRVGLGSFWLASILAAVYLGPTYALVQSIMPRHMRATAAAVQLLVINLIGLGFGPQMVGFVSDVLKPEYGNESLRWSLAIFACSHLPAALLYWIGSRHYRRELETFRTENAVPA